MNKADGLNEYQAAIEYGFSPDLLRWFTQNPVVDNKTLLFNEIDGVYYFTHDDLKELDRKMSGMWPLPPKGTRPTIPSGIKREIREEAQFSCPVCHRAQGELAHIQAVSKTFCNHPKNLLFLCPNHHSEYDFGHIFHNVSLDDVKAYKTSLQRFSKHQWQLKGKIIQTYLGALNTAVSLLKIHDAVSNSIDDKKFSEILSLTAEAIQSKKGKAPVDLRIESLEKEIEQYTEAHSTNICPLCNGAGATNFYDPCPICYGNGEIENDDSRIERLSEYELVDCRLCDGTGTRDGDDCPACDGERKVPQGWAEFHDWTQYELVDCRLCDGTGTRDGDDCPACDGERKVPQGWAEFHDWTQYEI